MEEMKTKYIYLSILLLSLTLLSGCMVNAPPPMTQSKDISYTPLPVVPARPHEGSIYDPDAETSLVADFRAKRVGDVLTIRIEENLKGAKDVKTKLGKSSEVNVGLTGLLGWEFNKRVSPRYPNQQVSASNAIGGTGTNKFDGQGQTSRDTSLSGTLSARVVKQLPGGNLLIRASREISINSETQYMILTGIVRRADIGAENEISSTRIADARISYTGGGDLSEMQHQGWLGRLMGVIAPF